MEKSQIAINNKAYSKLSDSSSTNLLICGGDFGLVILVVVPRLPFSSIAVRFLFFVRSFIENDKGAFQ